METPHLLIMIAIVIVIIGFQLYYFFKNQKLINIFKCIFPENVSSDYVVSRKDNIQITTRRLQDKDSLLAEKEFLNKEIENLTKEEDELNRYFENLEDEQYLEVQNYVKTGTLSTPHTITKKMDSDYRRLGTVKIELKTAKEKVKKITNEISKIDNLNNCEQNRAKNKSLNEIIRSINNYLDKNKDSVTDFNLIKDIVDRNCDSKEDEIQTQNPIPLYLGLMGTMAGIIVGVVVLINSGALANMMSTFDPTSIPGISGMPKDEAKIAIESARKIYESKAIIGIQALLEGVGIAMVSSIIGILLTTIGSIRTKSAKSDLEKNKHVFLSWMQAELLPKISSDASTAIVKLGKDISSFNNTFSSNAKLLQDTIEGITEATKEQKELINVIKELDTVGIAEANTSVYQNLKNCSTELGDLANKMRSVKDGIFGLEEKLENQINEYDKRQSYIKDASSSVDIAIGEAQKELAKSIKDSFENYKASIDNQYIELNKHTKEASDRYMKEADSLHKAIIEKLSDMKKLEDELKNLTSVKDSIISLERTTVEQNKKFDKLSQSIIELARTKAGDSVVSTTTKQDSFIPNWLKWVLLGCGVAAGTWAVVWSVLMFVR